VLLARPIHAGEFVAHPLIVPARASRFGSVAVVVARTGSRATVLRRSEPTRFSSACDDKVGGFPARSAASGSEQSTEKERLRSFLLRAAARDLPTLAGGDIVPARASRFGSVAVVVARRVHSAMCEQPLSKGGRQWIPVLRQKLRLVD
jgi:hypothetical protein